MRPLQIFAGILFLLPLAVAAQKAQSPSSLQIGVGMNANAYLGDLNYQDDSPLRAYPGINFSLQFDNTRALGVLINSGFARFTEQYDSFPLNDPAEYQPNRFVQSSFFYLDVGMRYFFFRRRKFRPFIAAGVGILSFDPQDQEGNSLVPNIFSRTPEEDSYLTLVAQFPLQAGMLIRINQQLGIKVSGIYRVSSTDYLDNIGEFGNKAGNDALLALQAELMFTLNRAEGVQKSPKAPSKPVEKIEPFVQSDYDFLMIWDEEGSKGPATLIQVEPVSHSRRQ